MNESIVAAIKRLKLSGTLQTMDVRIQEAVGNSLSHTHLLELIL